ncbi:hypothetical protein [Methanosarcina siciliae]|uniref:hypothetical protein n=1 Tax=Methanosarcina siciliae TaxID=38027 RepID=UPI000A6E5C2C|nr:hypothetical protein [Methanosarcina siciliae]
MTSKIIDWIKGYKLTWSDYVIVGVLLGFVLGAYIGYHQGKIDTLNYLMQLPHFP